MIRQTSVDCYHEIRDNGLLSEKRWDVYDVLYHYGPATGMELLSKMRRSIVDSQVRARLNELRNLDVAYEKQERICSITGMRVIEWDVTDRLPKKKKKQIKIKCHECNGKGFTLHDIPENAPDTPEINWRDV